MMAVWKRLLACLLMAGSAYGCCQAEYAWWSAESPVSGRRATMTYDVTGLGGTTTRVYVEEDARPSPYPLRKEDLAFSIHGCTIQYVFWLDPETIEIVLSPTMDSCTLDKGTIHPRDEVEILVTIPPDTSKVAVMGAVR